MTALDEAGAPEPHELAAPARLAAELSACVEELAAARMAAHELNNRLVLVSGYGELLADRLVGSEHEPIVQRIVAAAETAGGVLHDLQRLIRLQQRRLADLAGLQPRGLDEALTKVNAPPL